MQGADETPVTKARIKSAKKATAADRGTIGGGLFTRDRKLAGRV
jgi:hypothetical protein